MKIKIIAMLIFSALVFCSCSNENSSSKAETTSASTTTTTATTTVSADTNSIVTAEEKCTVTMDTISLHDGVDILDDEFIQKACSFKDYVLDNGISLDKRPENVPKGSYISIQLDKENKIYIASEDMTWAIVNGEYFEIGNEQLKEFYAYAYDYLQNLQ